MTAISRILRATLLALLALAVGEPGHAADRLVSKHRHWDVHCSENTAGRTLCHLLYSRPLSFTGKKADRFNLVYIGSAASDVRYFMPRPKYQQFHGFGKPMRVQVRVDGRDYAVETIECSPDLCGVIDIGTKVDVFRRGGVMTLRRLDGNGRPFGRTVNVSLAGFTAADRAARKQEGTEIGKNAEAWALSGDGTVTTRVPLGAYATTRHTLGVTCGGGGSSGNVTLFLQLEDHPDLANVDYIAIWHRLGDGEETKLRWTPAKLEDGTRGFELSGDNAKPMVAGLQSSEEFAVRTAWTKVTFDVAKNREVLSKLVAGCSGS